MIKIFSPPRALLRLLNLFFSRTEETFYLREMHRLLGEPVSSLQRHLNKLEKEGLLITKKTGPLKYFSINKEYPYFKKIQEIVLSEVRKEKLESELKKILVILKKKYKPQKVILFGSLGRGWAKPFSDLDLFIIKKEVPPRYWDRVKQLAPLLKNSQVGIDYLIWTPQEVQKEEKDNPFLKDEILNKGKVIYAKAT